ncbi:MAG: aminotransferase class I/II-fold pyridoxal phosphate-dependent enzyme [Caulobacter sp.]|nr:aminotransferase class I/II-fold pyridoxal phosphate-dependent enzyme [Caulobacter sp.]
MSTPDPFRAIEISRLAHRMKAEGASVIHMEFGQPSTGAPAGALVAAHQVLDADAMGYWESAPLCAALSERYRRLHGLQIEPGRIILTCGASPALVLALSTCFAPGDRVAVARPGYVAYRNTLKALHMVPLELACGADSRYQLTAAMIEALDPAPAGLIVASPGNPTGSILAAGEMKAIADVCRARGIRIISDEIYHGLSYVGPVPSMLEFEPEAVVINSFSKYFSMAGWRLGWMVAPTRLRERARAYVGNLFLTAPSLSQHAGLAAMDCIDELEGHIEVYRRNRALVLEALPRLGLTSIAPPDGAFYIWADVGHLTQDSMAFCSRLLAETGVATAPGVDFDPVEGGHFIRLSFAVSTAQIEEALRRLEPWFAAQPVS